MNVFQRGDKWYVEVEWRGWGRIKRSVPSESIGKRFAQDLQYLKDKEYRDQFAMVRAGTKTLAELHEDRETGRLLQWTREVSPPLGGLLDEWFAALPTLSTRRGHRYSPSTIERYEGNWDKLLEGLPEGRDAQLSTLTRGFFSAYRATRVKEVAYHGRTVSDATVKRDFTAAAAFFRWLRDEKDIAVATPTMPKIKEGRGRERWLTTEEIAQLEKACEPEWWPFFLTLIRTGLRHGEAAGLTVKDVDLKDNIIHVRNIKKNDGSEREVGIPPTLAKVLKKVIAGRIGPVFPIAWNRQTAYKAWVRNLGLAGLAEATMHDARHTFAVHSVRNGVPIQELRDLLGHSTLAMTERYMKYSQRDQLAANAARVEAGQLSSAGRKR